MSNGFNQREQQDALLAEIGKLRAAFAKSNQEVQALRREVLSLQKEKKALEEKLFSDSDLAIEMHKENQALHSKLKELKASIFDLKEGMEEKDKIVSQAIGKKTTRFGRLLRTNS